MSNTARAHQTISTPTQGSRRPKLPAPVHGVRWKIRHQPHPYLVRVVRLPEEPTKFRMFETVDRRPVLKVKNLPGSQKLPDNDVLLKLLELADPKSTAAITGALVGLCWLITETKDGFTVQLRVRDPHAPDGERVSPHPEPLSRSGWMAATKTALRVLRQTPGYSATTISETLESCRDVVNAGRL